MTRKTYCGNLLWQSSLTLLVPDDIRRIYDAGRKGHDFGSLVKAR